MRSTGLRLALIPTAVAVVSMLAACSSSSSPSSSPSSSVSSSPGSSQSPSTVTIAEILPNAAFAASYAAQGTGAIAAVEKEFGVKINFTQLGTAQNAVNAMLGGSAQMSVGDLTSFMLLQASGKPVVAAFAPFLGGGGVLIGAKKYESSRGTDLSKFAGATFGYTREGSTSQLYMKLATEKAGLSWNALPHVAFGTPSAGLPLLEAGRIAVAAVDPTTAADAIDAGQAYLILNLNDLKTSQPIIGEQLGTLYGFNKSFTTQYPALTKALVGALVKGLDAVKKVADDPAAVLKLFPSGIQQELSSGWAGAWQLSEPGVIASDGSMPAQAVKDTVSFSLSAGLLTAKQAATAPTVVDNGFVG
jgi:ABC-type nitrate/sulfonate/bicarbonate transport system substrate-binding protein